MWWFQEGLCFLPTALVIWTSATFVFVYIMAVEFRHVDPFFPYISDTGTVTPERCVFGIMLSVSAFLGFCTMYVRYKQVQALTYHEEKRLLILNKVALILGCTSSFGMCVVANFQKTSVFWMHLLGAALTFGVGALYMAMQVLVSFFMQPHVHPKRIFCVRLGLCIWTFSSIISMFVSSLIMYHAAGLEVNKKLHWFPEDPGYVAHMVSTVSEWSLAFSFVSFFFTYIRDFKKIRLRAEADLQSSNLHDHAPFGTAWSAEETTTLLSGSI